MERAELLQVFARTATEVAEKEFATATRRRGDATVVPPPVLARSTPDDVKAASGAWLASRTNVEALIALPVKLSGEVQDAAALGVAQLFSGQPPT